MYPSDNHGGASFGGGKNDKEYKPGTYRFIMMVIFSAIAAGLVFGIVRNVL